MSLTESDVKVSQRAHARHARAE